MNYLYKNLILINIIFVLIFSSCGGESKVIEETPTRGNIKISVDESFKLIIDTEIFTFSYLYNYANIKPFYKPEADAIADFMKDSVRTIVVGRKLTDSEIESLRSINIIARTTKIAYDGLAFVVNRENPDSSLRYDQIESMFKGKIDNWSQINPKSKLGKIKIIFDNVKSANVNYINQKFNLANKFPSYCSATNTNEEILDFVEKHKEYIGIISVNYISDNHDSTTQRFLHKVKVAEIGLPGDIKGESNFYKPYQAYLADGSYPFRREVYMICRETFAGLGSGFTSFVAGEKGQRIILKSGLVPATMPVRLVEIKK